MCIELQDVLVEVNLEWIKDRLSSNVDRKFCYYRDLNGVPEGTSEGQKILFSDGQEVRAESVLLEVSEGEFRFEPLTPVHRPHPSSPPARGYKYVDSESCGQYEINLMGIKHEFKTFHELMKGLLRNRPRCRNSLDELKFTVWRGVQGLDLNKREEWQERISVSDIRRVRHQLQADDVFFPPTELGELRDIFNMSTRANRKHDGFQGYLESVLDFYEGRAVDVEDLVEEFDSISESGGSESPNHDLVVERVSAQYSS